MGILRSPGHPTALSWIQMVPTTMIIIKFQILSLTSKCHKLERIVLSEELNEIMQVFLSSVSLHPSPNRVNFVVKQKNTTTNLQWLCIQPYPKVLFLYM